MAPWKRYRVSVEFDVPLAFAYRWCTDYTPEDGKYGGEDKTLHLQRRIIEKRGRRVVFENLYDEGKGWGWERHVVTLFPPRRWHCEGKGNHHESVLDYTLTALPRDRTRFNMRWRSRPVGPTAGRRPSAAVVEGYVAQLWRRRAKFLERDYRRWKRPSKSHRSR